jgi:hypothetical protein
MGSHNARLKFRFFLACSVSVLASTFLAILVSLPRHLYETNLSPGAIMTFLWGSYTIVAAFAVSNVVDSWRPPRTGLGVVVGACCSGFVGVMVFVDGLIMAAEAMGVHGFIAVAPPMLVCVPLIAVAMYVDDSVADVLFHEAKTAAVPSAGGRP